MIKKVIAIVAIIIWLFVIFKFSDTQGESSRAQSEGFTYRLVKGYYIAMEKLGFAENIPNAGEMSSIVEDFNRPIRKVAHATIYFVLAIIILFALNTSEDNFLKNMIITLIFCFLYSITDEFHQTFVPGRRGLFSDCIIDTCGAFLACRGI